MRLLRQVVNACIRPLAREAAPDVAAFDGRVLRRLARVASMLRIPGAERLGEAWMLDCFRILAGGIADTPYKAELALPYPLIVSVSSSNECVFGCSFCYSSSTAAPVRHASLTRELSSRIAASPVPVVFITGGEPLHHPHLTEVLEPILARGKKMLIATNAPSAKAGKELLPYREQITFLLSQWGTNPRHDAIRGRGNLERTWTGAERLAELGHRVSLNYILSSDSAAEDFDTVREILTGSPHIHRVYLSRQLLVGRTLGTRRARIDDDELRQGVRALRSQFHGRVIPVIPELQPVEGMFTPPVLVRLLGIATPKSCGAAAWTLHVDAHGDCYPCFAHEGQVPVGSLRNEDLGSIWRRARSLRQASPALAGTKCRAEAGRPILQLSPARNGGPS